MTSPPVKLAALARIAEDLALDGPPVALAGTPTAVRTPGHRWWTAEPAGPAPEAKAPLLEALERELALDGACLLAVFGQGGAPGAPAEALLARWRDQLWPLVHLAAVYSVDADGSLTRRTGDGRRLVLGAVEAPGRAYAVLAGRRRAFTMSPAQTTLKFDANAAGWDGRPGSAGYPHYRWMRRFVGRFAPARAGSRVLDFGSGAGWVGIEAARGSRDVVLRAFDPSPELVRIATENARTAGVRDFEARVGFGEDPPYPAAGEPAFDLTISSGVVSFAPELGPWLDGLARTVAHGGTLVIGDIHPRSRGFERRRAAKALLPVRELNAYPREEIRRHLEARCFRHRGSAGYQLTRPIPELMHVNETRLGGVLTYPLLWLNQAAAGLDRRVGSPFQRHFDSWVMAFTR